LTVSRDTSVPLRRPGSEVRDSLAWSRTRSQRRAILDLCQSSSPHQGQGCPREEDDEIQNLGSESERSPRGRRQKNFGASAMKKTAQWEFEARHRRQREEWRNGSHGAASGVRHIDPATYQPQPNPKNFRIHLKQNKAKTLLDRADALLIADAKRRGKRFGKRVRDLISARRYR